MSRPVLLALCLASLSLLVVRIAAQLEQFHMYEPDNKSLWRNGVQYNVTWFAPHSGQGALYLSTLDFKMAVPLIEGIPLYHPNVTGQEEGPFYNFWTVTCPGVAPGTYIVVLTQWTEDAGAGGGFYATEPFGIGDEPDTSTKFSEPFTEADSPTDVFATIRGTGSTFTPSDTGSDSATGTESSTSTPTIVPPIITPPVVPLPNRTVTDGPATQTGGGDGAVLVIVSRWLPALAATLVATML